MYKILLADEEGVAIESLRVIIDSDYGENCDIRLAVNTAQLNDVFAKFLPDIAFINIQMAGLRGISTIRDLHAKQDNCLFVITSYNNKVNYGREGMNMGIHSYMAKPLRHDQVKPLLKKCFSLLDTEAKRAERERYNKMQWDSAIPMMESGMISEILFPDPIDNNLFTYKVLLNIPYDYGWFMEMKYSEINEHGTMCNPIGSVVQLSNKYSYFRKVVKAFFPGAIIGPILANHVTVMIPCKNAVLTEEEVERHKKRADDLTHQLHKKMQLYFKYTISDVKKWL